MELTVQIPKWVKQANINALMNHELGDSVYVTIEGEIKMLNMVVADDINYNSILKLGIIIGHIFTQESITLPEGKNYVRNWLHINGVDQETSSQILDEADTGSINEAILLINNNAELHQVFTVLKID